MVSDGPRVGGVGCTGELDVVRRVVERDLGVRQCRNGLAVIGGRALRVGARPVVWSRRARFRIGLSISVPCEWSQADGEEGDVVAVVGCEAADEVVTDLVGRFGGERCGVSA